MKIHDETNNSRATWNHFLEFGKKNCEVNHGIITESHRHLTVQKDLGLLNGGTLNQGKNLCVTVAIDHSTVDGFHDELQLSAK